VYLDRSDIMARLLSRIFPLLVCCSAYAQTSPAEVVIEPASALTVEIFVFVFIASIVGFVGYTWWAGKKKKEKPGTEE
jgi:hypothetical protein